MNIAELQTTARKIRGQVIQMSHDAKTPHLGSSLSCVDILVSAYWTALKIDPQNPADPARDRLILSKGHAATTLFSVLAARGYFPEAVLATYAKDGSRLQEHPGAGCLPGVEWATGSLGHGLSAGLGMALAGKVQKANYRVVVVMSDGECEEGSVWEAALFAAAQKLNRVCVVVDYNKWQATGRSNEVMALTPLREKWASFGWDAYETDGHDIQLLSDLLNKEPHPDKPRAIIAHTVKGKGVSFMEDDNNWHYKVPNDEELQRAFAELGLT